VRKAMVVVAVTFTLGGSALSTNAFALASAYGGGHSDSGGDVFCSDHVGNSHRGLRHSHGLRPPARAARERGRSAFRII
jgi:hypothetical protein